MLSKIIFCITILIAIGLNVFLSIFVFLPQVFIGNIGVYSYRFGLEDFVIKYNERENTIKIAPKSSSDNLTFSLRNILPIQVNGFLTEFSRIEDPDSANNDSILLAKNCGGVKLTVSNLVNFEDNQNLIDLRCL